MQPVESVGIRELKQRTSEIIRLVEEQNQAIEITRRGKAVARLVPVREEEQRENDRQAWVELRRLAREVSAVWPKDVSAVEAIREQRREL